MISHYTVSGSIERAFSSFEVKRIFLKHGIYTLQQVASSKEQLAICIRWVDSRTLEPNEDVIGLYKLMTSLNCAGHQGSDALARMSLSFTR